MKQVWISCWIGAWIMKLWNNSVLPETKQKFKGNSFSLFHYAIFQIIFASSKAFSSFCAQLWKWMDEHRPRNILLIRIYIQYILLTVRTECILLQNQSLYSVRKYIPHFNIKRKKKKADTVEYRKYHKIHCTSKFHFHRNVWML